jgi:hypothetical protein
MIVSSGGNALVCAGSERAVKTKIKMMAEKKIFMFATQDGWRSAKVSGNFSA